MTQPLPDLIYGTTYYDDFVDATTDMPDELGRLISQLTECNIDLDRYKQEAHRLMDIITKADDNEDTTSITLKLQGILIRTQEIGDEKLEIVQTMQDMIDNKTRQLALDQKNCGIEKESKPEPIEPATKTETGDKKRVRRARQISIFDGTAVNPIASQYSQISRKSPDDSFSSVDYVSGASTSSSIIPSTSHSVTPSSSRHHQNTLPAFSQPSSSKIHTSSVSSAIVQSSQEKSQSVSVWSAPESQRERAGSSGNASAAGASSPSKRSEKKIDGNGDRKKLKLKRKKKQTGTGNSPPNLPVDPDEPTYCLCDQISYGEMIGCDNDLCPIEWFHFSCVSLTTKPKGKWYCPKCRGDRPTLMKPRAVFLKELEKYNKEKEEKA